jgi:hypothetical protein
MTSKKTPTSHGVPVDDVLVEKLAAEAELGYEPPRLRGRGRPTLGEGPSDVFPVRLDRGLRTALQRRAEDENTTPSDVVRRALRSYLGPA